MAARDQGLPKQKTEKELRKEAAKAEKLAKFEEKQKKLAEKAEAIKASGKVEKKEKKKEIFEYISDTKPGEKKSIINLLKCFIEKFNLDTQNEIPSSYNPRYVEAAWYDWWEKEGFFRPEYNRDLKYYYYYCLKLKIFFYLK